MAEALNRMNESIDQQHARESASTRRQMIGASGATLGGLGLLGLPGIAAATARPAAAGTNDPQTILNVAATAEVLATIVNTVGYQKVAFKDTPGIPGTAKVTKINIAAAAKEELLHFDVLQRLGGRPVTKTIFVPDAVFASMDGPQGLLNTVIVGDQIFINAYLIATTAFGLAGNGKLARAAAEFMGAEAVHRAVARQSLGLLGNDRVFMKFDQTESAPGPLPGLGGFRNVLGAVTELESVGFGFGKAGTFKGKAVQGQFYDFDVVRSQTTAVPDPGIDTPLPDTSTYGRPPVVRKPKHKAKPKHKVRRKVRR